MKQLILAAAVTLAAIAPAAAQNRPFDPREYQGRHIGQPTQILVIATPHLSGTPETFDPAVLEPLLERLAAFRPDAIAIEALPGRTIDQLWTWRESYPGAAQSYGGRSMALSGITRGYLGMDMAQADAEIRRTLATWPASPSPAQRRRLAALFIAAGDPSSAMVQWWRLDPSERVADDESVSRLLAGSSRHTTRWRAATKITSSPRASLCGSDKNASIRRTIRVTTTSPASKRTSQRSRKNPGWRS